MFYFIREFSTFLYIAACDYHLFSLHEDFILQSQPYILACVACTLHKFSSELLRFSRAPGTRLFGAQMRAYQHVRSRENHVPSVLRVGEQSESPERSLMSGSVQGREPTKCVNKALTQVSSASCKQK